MFGMFFLGALYLQRVLGYDALVVGLAFLPSTIVMGTRSLRCSGPLSMRFGARAVLISSLVSIGAGLLLLARTPVHGRYLVDLMPAMVLVGLGAGLGFPALVMLAMSGATDSDSGLASGLVNTSTRSAARSGSRCWPRWPASPATTCSPPAPRAPPRSTPATASPICAGPPLSPPRSSSP